MFWHHAAEPEGRGAHAGAVLPEAAGGGERTHSLQLLGVIVGILRRVCLRSLQLRLQRVQRRQLLCARRLLPRKPPCRLSRLINVCSMPHTPCSIQSHSRGPPPAFLNTGPNDQPPLPLPER